MCAYPAGPPSMPSCLRSTLRTDRAWAHAWPSSVPSCQSPGFQFHLEHRLQCFALLGSQIRHFVLVVQRVQPELHADAPPVVDYPKATALAFAAARIGESHLAQAARALN